MRVKVAMRNNLGKLKRKRKGGRLTSTALAAIGGSGGEKRDAVL